MMLVEILPVRTSKLKFAGQREEQKREFEANAERAIIVIRLKPSSLDTAKSLSGRALATIKLAPMAALGNPQSVKNT
jgi:hypothetical protein